MTGVWVNAAAAFAGGCIGVLLKKGISKRVEQAALSMVGLSVVIIGLNGVIASMFKADPATGALRDSGALVLLVSLVAGAVIGELWRLEDHIKRFGDRIERGWVPKGFLRAYQRFLIFSVEPCRWWAPSFRGSGATRVLLVKSAWILSPAVILGSTLGAGVLSPESRCLFIREPWRWRRAGFRRWSPTGPGLICMVGYCIVICIGTNFMGCQKNQYGQFTAGVTWTSHL
jgi:uncharacterized membrane protein YqgA involved in biofilm formation